ncbi:hypothetical protein AVEN_103232-1, partial [Araneus ventricosus]
CQDQGNEDSFHNYDLKLLSKSAEHVNASESLKLPSEYDFDSINELEKLLPVSINSALLDILSEASTNKCVGDLK